MAEPKVTAYLAHEIPGRLRLKIPEKRGDTAYFARLAEQVTQCPGVLDAAGKAHTGSLLVLHSSGTSTADIAAYAKRSGLFSLTAKPTVFPQTLLQHATAGANILDRGLSAASCGFLDLPSALLLTLVVLAIRQAAQGQVLIPAFSLLWYALELVTPTKRGAK